MDLEAIREQEELDPFGPLRGLWRSVRCRKWAVSRQRRPNPLRCHLLLPFGPPQCWKSSTMTPSRPPGPWFLAQAPSKLSIRPASTSMRPPRCDDFQRFERAKSSAGLGAHPPYCADRFCGGRVPASRRRAHRSWWGLRAKWPHAKCGAAALFCGVSPRLTPWAVRNSLGLPTGAFWLHTRPKKFRV